MIWAVLAWRWQARLKDFQYQWHYAVLRTSQYPGGIKRHTEQVVMQAQESVILPATLSDRTRMILSNLPHGVDSCSFGRQYIYQSFVACENGPRAQVRSGWHWLQQTDILISYFEESQLESWPTDNLQRSEMYKYRYSSLPLEPPSPELSKQRHQAPLSEINIAPS